MQVSIFKRNVPELHSLCRKGTQERIQDYIRKNPECVDKLHKGHSPLHEAVEHDNIDAVKILLINGADVNKATYSYRTPLSIATNRACEEIVDLLIGYNADPFLLDGAMRTPRSIALNFFRKRVSLISKILKHEFLFASEYNKEAELLQLLTDPQVEEYIEVREVKEDCFAIAIDCGHMRIVEILIEHGARQFTTSNISKAFDKNHDDIAFFVKACSLCHTYEVSYLRSLISEGSISEKAVEGRDTATHYMFLSQFNIMLLVMLLREAATYHHILDQQFLDDDIFMLIYNRFVVEKLYNPEPRSLNWSRLCLPYITSRWLSNVITDRPIVDLDISYNEITYLPDLSMLRNLEKFYCNNNRLKELHPSVFEIHNISLIDLSYNLLERIFAPNQVSNSLKHLNLSHNQIHTLPHELGVSSLTTLKLSHNKFTTFPLCVCNMHMLMHLEISSTKITDVPNELGRLEDIQYLDIPRIPRLEAFHSDLPNNPTNIMAFLKKRLYLLKPLYEMKLVLVGRESRGKTTLLRRLRKDYVTKRNLSTVGIEITDIKLPPSSNRRTLNFSREIHYTFHAWDFGGQEEYYATHQCFITPATLYIVVFSLAHGSKGIDELRVWLGNVAARAAGSTVIIVGTHLDKVTEEESLALLSKVHDRVTAWSFDVLVPVITSVSSEPEYKKTVAELSAAIVQTAENIKYKKKVVIGQTVPTSYIALIEELSRVKERYASQRQIPALTEEDFWDEIRQIPACEDIETEYQFSQVTDLMHNLGYILHFKEPSLQNQYFLDPKWLCRMMGQIVTIREKNPYIRDGILEKSKVRHMLKEKHFPDSMFNQYLRILNRFEIALKIDSDKILIPCLLPLNQPDSGAIMKKGKNYYKRIISFKNIPSGFLSRIMVSTICYLLAISKDIHPQENQSSQKRTTNMPKEKIAQDKEGITQGGKNDKAITQNEVEEENVDDAEERSMPRRRSNAITSSVRSVSVVSPASSIFSDPLLSPVELLVKVADELSSDTSSHDVSRAASHDMSHDPSPDRLSSATRSKESSKTLLTDLKSSNSSSALEVTLSSDVKVSDPSPNSDFENAFKSSPSSSTQFENKLFDILSSPAAKSHSAENSSALPIDNGDDDNEHFLNRLKSHFGLRGKREEKVLRRTVSADESNVEIREISLLEHAATRQNEEPTSPAYAILDREYFKCWRKGLVFNHEKLYLVIETVASETSEDLVFTVSRNSAGRKAICHIIDNISILIDDWYCGLSTPFEPTQVKQIIPCTICNNYNYCYQDCVDMILESDTISCPEHPETPVKLEHLLPDIFLSDLGTSELIENYKSIDFKESIECRIGGGSFGSVYQGSYKGKPVAVKKFYSVPMQPEAPFLELRREVNILKKVSNSCIVKMMAVCLRPSQCLVIEFAPEKDLEYHLSGPEFLPRLFIYKVLHQVASALAYLHNLGIIYRDLKPSNILVFTMDLIQTPNIKLSDYGIAGVAGGVGFKGLQGSTGYQAPEILVYKGAEEYTVSVDVYSFAILLYECICRRKAYSGMHRFDINKSVISNQRPSEYKVAAVSKFGMRNLKKLMEECWDQNPQSRPPMWSVAKSLSHPGYQMYMGHTMAPNPINTVATVAIYNSYSDSIWIGCKEEDARCTRIVTFTAASLRVMNVPDTEKGSVSLKCMAQVEDSVYVLSHSRYAVKIIKYKAFDDKAAPEIESYSHDYPISEQKSIKHDHCPITLHSFSNLLFIGHCCGLLSRTKIDGLKETVECNIILPCQTDVVCIFDRVRKDTSTPLNITARSGTHKQETELLVITSTRLYVMSANLKECKGYSIGGIRDPIITKSDRKLFYTIKYYPTIKIFNLVEMKKSSKVIDINNEQIQKEVKFNDLKIVSLQATEEQLLIGTNRGGIIILSARNSFRLLTCIRPCVGEVLLMLPYNPQYNLHGTTHPERVRCIQRSPTQNSGSSGSFCEGTGSGSRSHDRSYGNRSRDLRIRHPSCDEQVGSLRRQDINNSNYTAGTFLCVCGLGLFADPTRSLQDLPQSRHGDNHEGLFVSVLEVLPPQQVRASHVLYHHSSGLLD